MGTKIHFNDRDPQGHVIGRQATKVDLLDFARALAGSSGAIILDTHTVPELRAYIRGRLQALKDQGKI